VSEFWKEVCAILGVKIKLSTANHPQTDGQTEIVNQHMAQRLRPFINYYQDNWGELLPMIDFAAAALPHESTGISPFLVDCGYEPRVSFDWNRPSLESTPSANRINREDAQKLVKRMEEIWNFARDSMAKAQERQRVQANKHRREIDFEVGDRVYVSTKHWNTGRRSRKLADQMAGPFPIIAREGNAYRLQLPPGINVHPVVNPEYLRKDPNNPLSGQSEDPQPPIEVNGENEWEIEKILASRKRGRRLQYRASWVGHDPDPKWYNASNFKGAPHRLRDFHRNYPARPGPPRRLDHWLKCWEDDVEPEVYEDDDLPVDPTAA